MFSRPMINRFILNGISWYAVIIVAAILIGYVLANKESRRQGLPNDLIIDFLLLAIPLGIIGARLYFVVFRWNDYSDDLLSVLKIHEGGLAIYGGILGGLLAARIASKKHGIPLLKLLDTVAPSLVLGQAIGRWGNYINMEAYGLRVSEEALQFFPLAVEIPVGEIWYWHLATFFYEFCADLFIFLLLQVVKHHKRAEGDVFVWYLLLYTSVRVVIEGLRDDSLTFISDFVRISQVLSGITALVIVVYFFLRIRDRIGFITILPVMDSVLCFSLALVGEFERNAYSFLFKFSQILLLILFASKILIMVLWTMDSGRRDNTVAVPMLTGCLLNLVVFLLGVGKANDDNTYLVTARQLCAMTQLCLDGWLLCYPFHIHHHHSPSAVNRHAKHS